ncbi:MAG TPA: glycosyltransferase family 4 protein [Gemmatimonadaceae bacterium]
MRILLVNWQDRENPQAGGAEIHLHEIFGRLASQGHKVSLLCGGWPGCPPRAVLDGIEVTRVGTRNTFRLLARRGYREHFANQPFDVLVEDINKMPLYTPQWGRTPVVAVVPHLFGATAFQELSLPLATAVWLAERPIPWVYRDIPFEAISHSTADDLVARGLSRDQIRVIYCGIDSAYYTPDPSFRAETPVFAYLGRLKRYKGVDLVLRGFAQAAIPGARLEIAGAGDYRPALERLARSLDLDDRVTFLGRISEAEKLRLLRRAWALVFTSPKEGWGITNLEAAACGTAVIASDSPGIRESVRHGETGFLVRHGDIEALSASMRHLAGDRALAERLGRSGRAFAATFTWERAASETARHLDEVLERPRLEGGG